MPYLPDCEIDGTVLALGFPRTEFFPGAEAAGRMRSACFDLFLLDSMADNHESK